MFIKLLKKLVGLFGYKLINKNLIKNNRLLDNNNLITLNDILTYLFENEKIHNLIQIGANDGLRFDDINKFIKRYSPRTVLVEPINVYFENLIKNYQNYKNIFFENVAISIGDEIEYLYKVDEKNIHNYTDHVKGLNSFDIKHLKKHGVKSRHIRKERVKTISISNLINKYFDNLDLLLIDAESYDGFIILDLLENSNYRPLIISEYIHIDSGTMAKIIASLKKNEYSFFVIKENIICSPLEKKVSAKLGGY